MALMGLSASAQKAVPRKSLRVESCKSNLTGELNHYPVAESRLRPLASLALLSHLTPAHRERREIKKQILLSFLSVSPLSR
jgi:hypothetical protein